MRIAITGTPGTGKSAVAKALSRRTKWPAIEVYDLAKKIRALKGYDRARHTWIVDVKKLRRTAQRLRGDRIIVGHLSHFCTADIVVVLRTHPKVLAARLRRKRWSAAKVRENVEAEAIDVILQEAARVHPRRKIFEIDTTKRSANQTAGIILNIVRGKKRREFAPGKIDWTGYIGEM